MLRRTDAIEENQRFLRSTQREYQQEKYENGMKLKSEVSNLSLAVKQLRLRKINMTQNEELSRVMINKSMTARFYRVKLTKKIHN